MRFKIRDRQRHMRFDILTLFPGLFDSIFQESIVSRAIEAGLVEIHVHNIRDYAPGKHRVTDDTPYGGGGGMVMKIEPIANALEAIVDPDLLARQKATGITEVPVIVLTPAGRRFDQGQARTLERQGRAVLICGRYEAIDQRVVELFATDEVSLGDFVLSGGELAASVVIDAAVRLLPGVLGDAESAVQESHQSGLLDHPHFTRPEEIEGKSVPPVLLGGHHDAVRRWRLKQSLGRTWQWRPDLLAQRGLNAEEAELLAEYQREAGETPQPTCTGTKEAGKG
jgi:tRNA (guanine37-N1)-methyltransferase